MTRKMKAILVLFFAAEIVNSAKVGVLKGRIADLETQRDIYASRAQNWLDRAVEDEEVIDAVGNLQIGDERTHQARLANAGGEREARIERGTDQHGPAERGCHGIGLGGAGCLHHICDRSG